ncbi:MAG: CTP synthase [Candidatus Shapirobacteria bacterium]
MMKFIFISGGVISGLGKGVTAASIGLILKSKGLRVTNVKVDMYLNVDAGTIRPQEHGEVFVCDDGIETDQDLGNYERFLNENLRRENYMTTGQVYKAVIDRERAFGYGGEDVEAVPHITDEIIDRIKKAGKVNKSDVVIVELGGTVGEYQNGLFFEANRILKLQKPKDVIHIHVSYLPIIKSLGELKSKPAQQSTHLLNSMGIQPDFLVARSERGIDERRRERLALFCNLRSESIISNPDLDSIYRLPILFEEQKFGDKLLKSLHLKAKSNKGLVDWKKFVEKIDSKRKEIKIAIVGKYFATGDYQLSDSYLCVIEALKHAGAKTGVKPVLSWIGTDEVEKKGAKEVLKGFDAILVPQGWGSRGTEGKLETVRYARENKIPYLGLCFGMQMAVIEFARDKAGLKGANSTEADPKTKYPVVHVMPEQKKYLAQHQYGGTIRLGSWQCKVKTGTLLEKAYKKDGSYPNEIKNQIINERHRHRYEFNNEYRELLEKNGLIISGTSPDGKLVEAIELSKKDHPFFMATQFHPEYKSRPLSPHPIFVAYLEALK